MEHFCFAQTNSTVRLGKLKFVILRPSWIILKLHTRQYLANRRSHAKGELSTHSATYSNSYIKSYGFSLAATAVVVGDQNVAHKLEAPDFTEPLWMTILLDSNIYGWHDINLQIDMLYDRLTMSLISKLRSFPLGKIWKSRFYAKSICKPHYSTPSMAIKNRKTLRHNGRLPLWRSVFRFLIAIDGVE